MSPPSLYYSFHIVDVEINRKIIWEYVDYFGRCGIPVTVVRNQFKNNVGSTCEYKKIVRCRYSYFYIGPDGNRYICVSKLVRRVRDGIIGYETRSPEMICGEYGWCSACDEVADGRLELQ